MKTERKRKENGKNRNDFPESIGINRKTSELRANYDRKRLKTTENDRRNSLWFSHLVEWIPLKFPDFPLIFPDFPCIFHKKNTPGAESTEGYGYSLSPVVSFFGNIGGILLSTKTTARLITVVTPIAIAALS